jgi:hypothetical protein
MTSKKYSIIASVFMAFYIVTSLGTSAGLPDWIHQLCTIVFASSVFLGYREKRKEAAKLESEK